VFSPASFAWGLQSICALRRMPFSAELLLSQFPPPHDNAALQRAARTLGLTCATREITAAALPGQPLPCLAVLKPAAAAGAEPGAGEPAASPHGLAVVLRADGERVLLLEASAAAPVTVPRQDFESRFGGTVLLFAPAPDTAPAATHADSARRQFGFRWFVPELLKHRSIWRDVLAASLAIQLMALATPLFTQVVIDKVVVHHSVNTLIVIGTGMAVFLVFSAAMSWIRQYLVLHTGNRIDAVLGSQVLEHLFRLPPRYFEHRPTGTVVARLHGVETIREFLSGAFVTLLLDVPFLFVFLAIMFHYSVTLTAAALVVIGLIVALSLLVTPLLRERLNRQFLLGARNQAFLTEYVAGLETVKSLQMEPQVNARYGELLASYLRASFATRQLANTYHVAANALEQFLTLVILCAGAWLVMTSQTMTIGMLVAFQMFASRLSGPMLRMVGLWQEFQQADIAVKRLGDILDAPTEPYSVVPARESAGKGRITIQGLAFRYADNLPWLYRDFHLTVEPGRTIAIMGPSGSGKSTLARLLQGFYQPQDGAILLDGHDARHLSANELRRHFGVVPQETVLFSGTIYENLVIASPLAGFDDVVQACKLAEIHDTIERLPQGYQTPIGERGTGLSGGQKQRIAIARALLKRPRILVFDEPTSSLDPATAEHFARTINRLRGQATMLFIAHHLPANLQVDEVIRLGGALQPVAAPRDAEPRAV
jgi:subfamily B ATP-binding cassette protein HlyB/CyaB